LSHSAFQLDRRRFLGGAATLGALALRPTRAVATAAPATAMPLRSWTALQALADRYVAGRKVAGMIIGVGLGDALADYVSAGTLGWERAARPDPASIFRIYSMTKPVTGVLATMLIADGKLGLDQPIADFLPAFANMRVATDPARGLDGTPAKTAISVRHLLTHTAGLTYHFQPNSAVARAYRAHGLMPGLRTLGREPGDGAHPSSLQAFAEAVAKLPLVAEPGTTWHYSISIDVLGAVIEKAGGAPLGDQMRTRLFDPLGMTDTGFAVAAHAMDRFATNYLLQDGKLVAIDVPPKTEYADAGPYPSGGGGLVSTAADYLRFLRALADGGRLDGNSVIAPAAVRMATSNLLPAGVAYEGNQGFGAGGRVVIAPGGGIMGSFGWGGAAGTLASTVPGQRLSAVLMTQYMPQQAYPLPVEFARAIMTDMAV
jgi:CubicO group peptidase (beta-lactamase class C family)